MQNKSTQPRSNKRTKKQTTTTTKNKQTHTSLQVTTATADPGKFIRGVLKTLFSNQRISLRAILTPLEKQLDRGVQLLLKEIRTSISKERYINLWFSRGLRVRTLPLDPLTNRGKNYKEHRLSPLWLYNVNLVQPDLLTHLGREKHLKV